MMKKLKFLILALIGCIGISSCTNELSYPKQDKVQLVKNPDFIAWSGQEVFGNTFTYSTVKPDGGTTWNDYNQATNAPSLISEEERDLVEEWFRTHKNPTSISIDWGHYYAQQLWYKDITYTAKDGNTQYNPLNDLTNVSYWSENYQRDNIMISPANFNQLYEIGWESNTDNFTKYFGYTTKGLGDQYQLNINDNIVSLAVLVKINDSYYVGFDFMCWGNNQNEKVEPDGFYDDRIIKLTNYNPNYSDDIPSINYPENLTTGIDKHNDEVEVNLELVDSHTQHGIADLTSKLSIHVRCATNVTIEIPISAKYTIDSDDLYIFNKHYIDESYGTSKIEYNIAGQTVVLKVTAMPEKLIITTEGINEQVIEYCQEHYKDGINFEVWTYYQGGDRDDLLSLLNGSTISFSPKNPKYYINAFGYDWNELDKLDDINPDDCYVRPSENYGEPNRTEHLNGTPYNDIYTLLN